MNQKILLTSLAVVFLLFIINIGASFYFFKQYKDNISYFDQQNWLTRVKIENMEKNVEGYKTTVDNLNTQFNTYAQNFSTMEKKVGMSETEQKDMVAKIDGIKSEMSEWQKNYNAFVTEAKERAELLRANVEQLAKGITEQVNLGKISVKGDSEAAQNTNPVPVTKQATKDSKTSSASKSNNFAAKK